MAIRTWPDLTCLLVTGSISHGFHFLVSVWKSYSVSHLSRYLTKHGPARSCISSNVTHFMTQTYLTIPHFTSCFVSVAEVHTILMYTHTVCPYNATKKYICINKISFELLFCFLNFMFLDKSLYKPSDKKSNFYKNFSLWNSYSLTKHHQLTRKHGKLWRIKKDQRQDDGRHIRRHNGISSVNVDDKRISK